MPHVHLKQTTAAAWAAALACSIAWPAAGSVTLPQGSAPAALTVTAHSTARALQPGEAVVIAVRTSAPAERVSGDSFKGPLHFVRGADPLEWEAIAGIDVNAQPGRRDLKIRAHANGAVAEASLAVAIQARRFPDRRITVPPEFLTPPAAEMPRIERETKRLASVLAAVSPGRLWEGGFAAPVPGGVTSAFGRTSIVNGVRRSPHAGLDLAASEGTPVRAPAAGTVVLSDALYFGGETIVIDHGLGVFTLVAHLSARHRREGDRVTQGEVVGLSGATGRVTGPHLHWSAHVAGARVDPQSLVWATSR